jgi:hypothetical protein
MIGKKMCEDWLYVGGGDWCLERFVLDNLHMGSQDALFGMDFWMCSIVDIRMVSLVSWWLVLKDAWVPPQGIALADHRGQRHPSPNRCWVG